MPSRLRVAWRLAGKSPSCALYSTFMQRAFDQLVINNALANTNVVFCLDRAGLVGDDGPTHHGVFDIVYGRMVPGVRMMAPSDEAELVHMLHTALALEAPVILRWPRGEARGVELPAVSQVLEEGKSRTTREGSDVAILAFGRMVQEAEGAADILAKEGVFVRVVDMRWIKPFDEEAVRKAALECKLVCTAEEGAIEGGIGEGILEALASNPPAQVPPVLTFGIPDEFVEQGKVPQLHRMLRHRFVWHGCSHSREIRGAVGVAKKTAQPGAPQPEKTETEENSLGRFAD